jgi:hypothetical protein
MVIFVLMSVTFVMMLIPGVLDTMLDDLDKFEKWGDDNL